MINSKKIRYVLLAGLLLFPGCRKNTSQLTPSLDVHHMPAQAPNDVQQQLAWGLWNLDIHSIKNALEAGAQPFALAQAIEGLRPIPAQEQLSPYAIIIEGYLNRTYMEEEYEKIHSALDAMYDCLELLISYNISVDQGITTLEGYPTLREFVQRSIARLNNEQAEQEMLDEEGEYALSLLQHLQKSIEQNFPLAK